MANGVVAAWLDDLKRALVILTGSTRVEGGLDGLLAAAGKARKVVIADPTAPAWLAPFFSRGVRVPAGIQVRDSRKMLQIVSEGGSGAFFSAAAAKICVVRQPLEERTGALPVSASP